MNAAPDLSPMGKPALQAVHQIPDVQDDTVAICLPAGLAARHVEVVVLPAADEVASTRPRPRRQAPGLAGTIVRDDLLEPAASAEEWEALM